MKKENHKTDVKPQKHQTDAKLHMEYNESPDDLLRAYIELYKNETDEQLYQRLRDLAAELGRIPKKSEVPGSGYIKTRLGNWPRIMEQAGIKPVRQKYRHS